MARICAFVFNPAIRDARVIKEANSLTAAGHHVTIIGLADNNFPEERVALETGVEILRVPKDAVSGSQSSNVLTFLSKALRIKSVDFIIVILVLIYATFFPANVWDLINLLLNHANVILIIGSLLYLIKNFSRLRRASAGLIKNALSILLGEERLNELRYRIFDSAKFVAPTLFAAVVEQRSQLRTAHMVRLAQALSPDIVHCHDIHTLPAGAAMKRLTGCRVIYDAHEIYEEVAQSDPEACRRYRAMHRKYLPAIDGFVTINESIAGWYVENYPQIPEPVVVMNATVRAPRFDYDGRLHKAAELPAGQKILIYQGGYASKRGLEYLVRSAAFLSSEWTLVMMGWGRLEPALRSIAEEIDSTEAGKRSVPAVRFLPPVPQSELAYWSAGATIGVIPYENVGLNHWFCTPNKLWEYPNAGVPLLVSPFPELRKPIEQYGHGWLLPDDQEPRKLAEQVAGLGDEEIARARKACVTFSDADEWSKYGSRLLTLYERIVGAPDIPAAPSATAVAEKKFSGQKKRESSKRA